VIDMINTTVPGLSIVPDTKTRRLNIYATPDELQQVRNIVKELDGGAGPSATVIQLYHNDPVAVATSIRGLFTGDRRDAPGIEPDAQGRKLLIRGTPEQVAQIRKLLLEMGEPGDGSSMVAGTGGPLRSI